MRVRTAVVQLTDHQGLERLFDRAVERHLAWIVGTGSPTEELVSAGSDKGYHVWHPDLEDFEPVDTWLAIRQDLIDTDTWTDGGNRVLFNTTNAQLGEVTLGEDVDVVGWTDLERIKGVAVSAPSDEAGFNYTEHLYTVTPTDR